ncbi:Uncharacterized protein Rs2_38799 [Raphanus sativus]|nr:Uncharacterized protein Rs2_38799 [Raphanus sativus]
MNRSLEDTRHGSFSRDYSAQFAFSQLLGTVRSLAATHDESFSRDRSLAVTWSLSRSHMTLALSLLLGADPSLAVATLSQLLGMDRSLTNSKSFKVARGSWASNHEAFHRQIVVRRSRYSTRITLSPLLGTARSLAVTRHGSISRRYLAMLVLSPLLGTARSLAVTWQSSFSRGHSARSLAVTRLALSRSLGLPSRGHSARSLAVTRLALSRSLGAYRSLTISRDNSFVTACSWWYVHDDVCGDLSLTASQLTLPSIATNSGGSEHCPHRSFTQLSPSKLRLESEVCP